MGIIESYSIVIPVIVIYMTIFFVISFIQKDNSIADVIWGPGFLVAALAAMIAGGSWGARNILVTALTGLWALRLAVRIGLRNRGGGEDWRYRNWRAAWGRWFYLRSWLQVFMLQGLIMLVNAAPLVVVNSRPADRLVWTDALGLAIWIAGFVFELVADWQMDRFKSDPANRGRFITTGLWAYSRHPNYFGEITLWWGFYVLAIAVPGGPWSFVGPLIITIMLVFVSGIPMTEKKRAHDQAYQEYRRRTSALVPWFPGR